MKYLSAEHYAILALFCVGLFASIVWGLRKSHPDLFTPEGFKDPTGIARAVDCALICLMAVCVWDIVVSFLEVQFFLDVMNRRAGQGDDLRAAGRAVDTRRAFMGILVMVTNLTAIVCVDRKSTRLNSSHT